MKTLSIALLGFLLTLVMSVTAIETRGEEVIFANGTLTGDDVTALLHSQHSFEPDYNTRTADDWVGLWCPGIVDGCDWVGFWPHIWRGLPQGFGFEIYADASGLPTDPPGEPLFSTYVEYSETTVTWLREYNNDNSLYRYSCAWPDEFDYGSGGPYWLMVWTYWSYEPISGVGGTPNIIFGQQAAHASEMLDYPGWMPIEEIYGQPYGFPFILYGETYIGIEETSFGAIKAMFN